MLDASRERLRHRAVAAQRWDVPAGCRGQRPPGQRRSAVAQSAASLRAALGSRASPQPPLRQPVPHLSPRLHRASWLQSPWPYSPNSPAALPTPRGRSPARARPWLPPPLARRHESSSQPLHAGPRVLLLKARPRAHALPRRADASAPRLAGQSPLRHGPTTEQPPAGDAQSLAPRESCSQLRAAVAREPQSAHVVSTAAQSAGALPPGELLQPGRLPLRPACLPPSARWPPLEAVQPRRQDVPEHGAPSRQPVCARGSSAPRRPASISATGQMRAWLPPPSCSPRRCRRAAHPGGHAPFRPRRPRSNCSASSARSRQSPIERPVWTGS